MAYDIGSMFSSSNSVENLVGISSDAPFLEHMNTGDSGATAIEHLTT